MKPSISVVIPTYNSSKTLESCLRSLINQDFSQGYEIIVVDDGSVDDSCKIAEKMGVRVIKLKAHTGFVGLVRNLGVMKANADMIAFIDSDCVARRDWLKEFYEIIKREKCVMGPQICVANNMLALPSTKASRSWYEWSVSQNGRVKSLTSGNMAIKKLVFTEAGGFVPWLRRSEDKELGIRLMRQGVRIRYAPRAVAYHLKHITFRSIFIKKFYKGIDHVHISRIYDNFEIRFFKIVVKILRNFIKIAYLPLQKEDRLGFLLSIIGNVAYLCGLIRGSIEVLQ